MSLDALQFTDRTEAGRLLAEALLAYRDQDVLVLGIPRGGVPVAVEVARALHAALDIVVARKLGAPGQPELAIGAVTANGGKYFNTEYIESLAVSHGYLERETERKMTEAREREQRLRAGAPPRIRDRIVIVVDDGLATGATMRAALRSVRQAEPRRLVMAVPVGAPETCDDMREEADEVVCLRQPALFYAVGQFYADFTTVEDDEVATILRASRSLSGASPSARNVRAAIEIAFQNDAGHQLVGTLELPEAHGPVPVVVFAHGMGSGRASSRNRAIAAKLLDRGIASFLIDFTGHGDSEGVIAEASVERMAQDLRAALDALDRRDEVDRLRVGVSGSSSGGIVAMVVAAGDERVRALVLRSVPASGLEDVARHIHAPTLLIAGSRDHPIVTDDEALCALVPAEHHFEVIDGAGHLFEGPGQAERVADLSAAWFAERLAAHPKTRSGGSDEQRKPA